MDGNDREDTQSIGSIDQNRRSCAGVEKESGYGIPLTANERYRRQPCLMEGKPLSCAVSQPTIGRVSRRNEALGPLPLQTS